MAASGRRFTYADYLLTSDDERYEVIDGELLEIPTPTVSHQVISAHLLVQLANFVSGGCRGYLLPGPLDVILSEENIVQPDIVFVAHQRQSIINWEGGIHGAPDLVVEILSPSTADRDKVLKRQLYALFRVKEYWIVDPGAQSIEVLVYSPAGMETWRQFTAGSALTSPTLDGLVIPVDSVFEA